MIANQRGWVTARVGSLLIAWVLIAQSPNRCTRKTGDNIMATQVATSLEMSSMAFEQEGTIPSKHTCDGQNVSPPLRWSPGPKGTQSYALIMDDPDAPGGTFVHWVVWNIVGNQLQEHVPAPGAPAGGAQGTNSFKKMGYGGPCPPSGTHRYFFHVYALDRTLSLNSSTTKQQLLEAMNGHILAHGELMAKYSRKK